MNKTDSIFTKALVCLLLYWSSLVSAETTITHIKPLLEQDIRAVYYIDVLRLAMEKSAEKYGPYKLESTPMRMPRSRALFLITKGIEVDVHWMMTSPEREKDLLPIRIPIQKGLLGYRIFIIAKGNQPYFSNISTIEELQELVAGQGTDWSDTPILKHNNIAVQESNSYDSLFRMLSVGRFDYFPRGLAEPFTEVESRPELKLEIERELMLKYPSPVFFFVNRKNPELAQRIEFGLRTAIEDGSFDELFYNHPAINYALQESNFSSRRVFILANPLLTDETQKILKEPELWHQAWE